MADNKYHLDAHCEAILTEYREHLPAFEAAAQKAYEKLWTVFEKAGLVVASIEYRVKTEQSLVGKLELGVAGAAGATVVSQFIAAICCYIYAFVRYPILRFRPADSEYRTE